MPSSACKKKPARSKSLVLHSAPVFASYSLVVRPRTSTLFPYTTLFRSGVLVEDEVRVAAPGSEQGVLEAGAGDPLEVDGRDDLVGVDVAAPQRDADAGDRKSTRLNSSHVAISYAVFCL